MYIMEMRKPVKVVAIAHSVGIIIPAAIAHALEIRRGDFLDVRLIDSGVFAVSKIKTVVYDNPAIVERVRLLRRQHE